MPETVPSAAETRQPRPLRMTVLLNQGGGTMRDMSPEETTRLVASRLEARGHQVSVEALDADGMADRVRRAAREDGVDAVLVGGGDGTVSTAARALAGSGKALGVLPLGTFNLIARDLKVPDALEPALDALAAGEIRPIDLGEVNGKTFVNHASLGVHPWMIRHRDQQRSRFGFRRKWYPMLRAWARAVRRYPQVEIALTADRVTRHIRTPGLVVANNRIADRAGLAPGHDELDRGELAVYVARARSRIDFLRLLATLPLGHWNDNPLMEHFTAADLVVRSRRPLRVSIDGEVETMEPPLNFRIRRRVLPVLMPAEPGGAAPGAAAPGGTAAATPGAEARP